VNPAEVPTVAAAREMGFCSDLNKVNFPLLQPAELEVENWQLPTIKKPIDFGIPRIIRSTFKHIYVKFIQEPMNI
ncbi:MAG: thylakoid-associated protein, partial [Okeania sp. SIO2D1]|nr:thylakoid-associated protein [Okeania sp. SIO2D1]